MPVPLRLARYLMPLCVGLLLTLVLAPSCRAATPSVYWGANIDDHLTGGAPPYDMTAADKFESMVGKSMSLIEYSLPWAHCYEQPCTFVPFPTTQMEAIRQHGSIPVFGWASYSQPLSVNQPDYKLSRITAGAFDDFIRQWARDARAWGHPFFLVFNWEMNLTGPWSYVETVNGNQPGDFVKAWRHVHDIFVQEGATNATWTWIPNAAYDDASSQIAGLYPGDDYVDWTGVDAYNWPWNWQSFGDMLGFTYDAVQAVAPTKPMLMSETASTESGGSKAAWITDMLDQIPKRFPNLKGFAWFEKQEAGLNPGSPDGWPVESSASSLLAFQQGIASPVYAGADYGNLPAAPIPPLTPVVLPNDNPGPGPGPGPSPNPTPCQSQADRKLSRCKRGTMVRSVKINKTVRRLLRPARLTLAKRPTVSFRLVDNANVTMRFYRYSKKRWVYTRQSLSYPLTKGLRGISFSGRIAKGKTLKVGRYLVRFQAVDNQGRVAKTVSAKFALSKR